MGNCIRNKGMVWEKGGREVNLCQEADRPLIEMVDDGGSATGPDKDNGDNDDNDDGGVSRGRTGQPL